MTCKSAASACSSIEKQRISLACRFVAGDSADQDIAKLLDALQLSQRQQQQQQHACHSHKLQCCTELARLCSMLPEIVRTYRRQIDSALAEIKRITADRDQKANTIHTQEDLVSRLQQDNKRYAELNRDLNVRARGHLHRNCQ